MESVLLKDIKQSLKMFRNNVGFAVTVITVLALGIGSNTAIFSIVNTVLLKPLPFRDSDRLVYLVTSPGPANTPASPTKFEYWRQQTSALEYVSAYRAGVVNYTGGDIVEQFRSMLVSVDYFSCLGAPIVRGRAFTPDESVPNGRRSVLITDGLWRRRFSSDPEIIGKTISLDGDAHTVVGIVDSTFDLSEFGPPPDVFIAFQLDPNSIDRGNYLAAMARLKEGVTLDQARALLRVSAERFRLRYPNHLEPHESFSVTPLREVLASNVRVWLLVLEGAVVMVLLIACANVATLLLARGSSRSRDIAIRVALGAGRARIVRQLLTESVLLSLTGGALGLFLGFVSIRELLYVNTAGLPRVGEDGAAVAVDWRVLGFTILVSVLTGLVFGLMPALQASRTDLNRVLKESSGRTGTSFGQNKVRSLLVVIEIALSVILLVGSSLLIRTAIALGSIDPGFDTKNLLTMRMSLTGSRFAKSKALQEVLRDSLNRVRAIPGVVDATATCCAPLQGNFGLPFSVVGWPLNGPYHGQADWSTHSIGFFETLRIPIKRGRTFTEHDDSNGPPVIIINEAMAKQFWVDKDPLKDRLIIGTAGGRALMRELEGEPVRQIIGVVGDVRDSGLDRVPQPHMYVRYGQLTDAINSLTTTFKPITWIVRTQGEPMALSNAIREQLRQSTGLPVSEIRSMQEVVSRSIARQRFNLLLMTIFGYAALLVAATGIYGLMAYTVEQRRHEVGVRLALGAEASQVKRMIIFQGMRVALVGVAIGVACAFGLTRLLAGVLFRVQPHDPIVFISVPLLLGLVAFFAVLLPANRVSKVDPLDSLRYE